MIALDSLASVRFFLPELILAGFALVLLLAGLFIGDKQRQRLAGLAWVGLAIALVSLIPDFPGQGQSLFRGMIVFDTFAIFFKVFAIGVTAFVILFTCRSLEIKRHVSEFFALLLVSALGMSLMASAVDLLMMYIALEMVSIPCYVLAGYHKGSSRSAEAALKYVIYGGVSSGIMLFGMSLLFGLTGHTNLFAINQYLADHPVYLLPLLLAILFILAGLGYKIAAVPFHFWCPDVYEGAPTPVAAFLSVGPKAAGFALMIRFFYVTLVSADGQLASVVAGLNWPMILAVIAAVSMSLGNLAALAQRNVKRLLAYSGIAHAGYILMGLAVVNHDGLTASLFYLLVYLFMNLGAFLVVIYLSQLLGSEDIEDYRGLVWRSPVLAIAMGIFLLSLIGIPPLAGFIAKFYIFAAVIDAEMYWLAVIGLVNSTIAVYYYAKILRAMFLSPETGKEGLVLPAFDKGLLAVMIAPLLVFGVYWVPAMRFAKLSFLVFRGH
ncbi:MAG: NADH-quinone oxidoreductase subunit N [Thermodesulfobacteriota bacterium]